MPADDKTHLSFRAIFISDVHLGFHGCRAEQLLRFLRAARTDRLYLVGDIIDLESLSRSFYWPQAHNDVIRTLLGKAKHGTKITYVPGNHDAAFREYCGLKFGNLEVRRRCLFTRKNGQRYLVTHGDEFDRDIACSRWLAWLGSAAYRRLMYANTLLNRLRRLGGKDHWSLASFLKRYSATVHRYIASFEQTAAGAASRRRLDGVICGHIHRPACDTLDGIEYLNDGDWVEHCTALVEHLDGRMELLFWPDAPAAVPAALAPRLSQAA